MPKKTSIGGQAVIEGIMMKGPYKTSMAVRKKDGTIDISEVEEKLKLLKEALDSSKNEVDSSKIKAVMKQVVSTYHDPEEVNCRAEESEEMQNTKSVSETAEQ